LQTLEVRRERQTASARAIAEPCGRIRQSRSFATPGFGGLMSFDVADAAAAHRVETSTRVIANVTSLGGVTSRIEARARWEGDRVPPGMLRVPIGLESADELHADLEQALDRLDGD
jgi:cystathionine beta-lyase/cystathionine gamma-synthase